MIRLYNILIILLLRPIAFLFWNTIKVTFILKSGAKISVRLKKWDFTPGKTISYSTLPILGKLAYIKPEEIVAIYEDYL